MDTSLFFAFGEEQETGPGSVLTQGTASPTADRASGPVEHPVLTRHKTVKLSRKSRPRG